VPPKIKIKKNGSTIWKLIAWENKVEQGISGQITILQYFLLKYSCLSWRKGR
jgi:hypothetical protein